MYEKNIVQCHSSPKLAFEHLFFIVKKSLYIDLSTHFSIAPDVPAQPVLPISHATVTSYAQGKDTAIQQEFDGHYGYLYSYEMALAQTTSVPIQVDRGDLHVLYLMEGEGTIVLEDHTSYQICGLSAHRGRYLYLPPGSYRLRLPRGHLILFGFYFDGGIFREGNERRFNFLQEVIFGYRNQSAVPHYSKDFRIDTQTLLRIQYLCNNLKKKDFSNESFLLNELSKLVELSREKVIEQHVNEQHGLRIAEKAQHLWITYIAEYGQAASLGKIAQALQLNPDYINRLHKCYFGRTLQSLKNELLLKRAVDLLQSGENITQTAYQCGYSSVESFHHFFKTQTGMSPSAYLRIIKRL